MNRLCRPAAAVILTFAAALISVSCSSSAPEISRVEYQQNFRLSPESGKITAELAVLAGLKDEDGEGDLDVMTFICGNRELVWSVSAGDWSSRKWKGIDWKGAERLVMPSGNPFPKGDIVVAAADKSGKSAERVISVQRTDQLPSAGEFPDILFEDSGGDIFMINSPFDENIISFYNSEGNLIRAVRLKPGRWRISELPSGSDISAEWKYVQTAAMDKVRGFGLINGPAERGASGEAES